MPNTVGTAYVQILPSAKGIKGNIEKAISPEAVSAGNIAGTKVSTSMGSKIKNAGKSIFKAGAIATAVSVPIIAGIKKALNAYQIQNGAETKLTEIYKTRMGATKDVAKETMKLASALQKEGVIGDEVTLSGAQQLATFAKYPSTVNSLLPAMNNLLVQQKGLNATSQDATGIANLMGKVMQGQTGALKRVGVSFDENQEKILKYGTEEERAATLAEVITQNVGNMNKVMAKTPEGRIQQMKNSLGDMAESLGKVLIPVLSKIAQWVSKKLVPKMEAFFDFLNKHPAIRNLVIALTGLLVVAGPLLMSIGSLMMAFSAMQTVMSVLVGPIGLVVAAIAAVAVVVFLVIKNWKTIKAFLLKVWQSIKATAQAVFGAIRNFIVGVWNRIKNAAMTVWNAVKGFLVGLWTGLKERASAVWNAIKSALSKAWNGMKKAAQAIWGAIKGFFVKTWNGLKKRAASVWNGMKATASKVWNGIKNVASTVWGGIKNTVLRPVRALKSGVSKIWNGIKTTASNVWNKIKSAITKPITTAKEKVKSIIDKIKGFFSFKWKLPKLKLPHFAITPKGWKFKDLLKGKIPKLGISWYAKGGIMDKPTVFGGGEAGSEAILPLTPFWQRFDNMADSIVNGVNTQMAAAGSAPGPVTIELYAFPSGPKMDSWVVETYDRGKRRLGK